MLKFRFAYLLLMILFAKAVTGSPLFGFDILGAFDDEGDEMDTNSMEKNGKIFSDWLTSIFDYFYDDSDEANADDKYLICKNCTVIVGESQNQNSQTSSTTITPATVTDVDSSSSTQPPSSNDESPAAGGEP